MLQLFNDCSLPAQNSSEQFRAARNDKRYLVSVASSGEPQAMKKVGANLMADRWCWEEVGRNALLALWYFLKRRFLRPADGVRCRYILHRGKANVTQWVSQNDDDDKQGTLSASRKERLP